MIWGQKAKDCSLVGPVPGLLSTELEANVCVLFKALSWQSPVTAEMGNSHNS